MLSCQYIFAFTVRCDGAHRVQAGYSGHGYLGPCRTRDARAWEGGNGNIWGGSFFLRVHALSNKQPKILGRKIYKTFSLGNHEMLFKTQSESFQMCSVKILRKTVLFKNNNWYMYCKSIHSFQTIVIFKLWLILSIISMRQSPRQKKARSNANGSVGKWK